MKSLSVIRNVLAVFGLVFIGLLFYTKVIVNTSYWNKDGGMDTVQEFNTARIQMFDNSVKVVDVKSWRDFDYSDQIQITTTSGVTYLTSIERVILINDRSINPNR